MQSIESLQGSQRSCRRVLVRPVTKYFINSNLKLRDGGYSRNHVPKFHTKCNFNYFVNISKSLWKLNSPISEFDWVARTSSCAFWLLHWTNKQLHRCNSLQTPDTVHRSDTNEVNWNVIKLIHSFYFFARKNLLVFSQFVGSNNRRPVPWVCAFVWWGEKRATQELISTVKEIVILFITC